MKSKIGWTFALIYLAVSAALIFSQGLFGESFIAIILGIPWSFLLAYFEFFNAAGAAAYILVLVPIVLNALLLYWIGRFVGREKK